MMHYTCDACCRAIDQEQETRYVVRVEVYAALGDSGGDDPDEDHLQEIEDLLERIDGVDEQELDEGLYKQVRYDLCSECRQRFLKNPLGRSGSIQLGFSQN